LYLITKVCTINTASKLLLVVLVVGKPYRK
jgi:hypothetical protein